MSDLLGKEFLNSGNGSLFGSSLNYLFDNFGKTIKENRLVRKTKECIVLARICLFELEEEINLNVHYYQMKGMDDVPDNVKTSLLERKTLLKSIFDNGVVIGEDGLPMRETSLTKYTMNPITSELIDDADRLITKIKKSAAKASSDFTRECLCNKITDLVGEHSRSTHSVTWAHKMINSLCQIFPEIIKSSIEGPEIVYYLENSLIEEQRKIRDNVDTLKTMIEHMRVTQPLNKLNRKELLRRLVDAQKMIEKLT